MSSPENQKPVASQETSAKSDDELLKGCLHSLLKFVGLFAAFIGLLFLLANNYKVGSTAFDKGLWDSAVFFLENVKTTDEHYKDAQEKLRIAKEKIEQEQKDQPK